MDDENYVQFGMLFLSSQGGNNTFKTELFQQNKPYRTQLAFFFKSSWTHTKAPDLRHSTSTLLQMTHLCYLSFSGSWQDGSKVNTWAVNVLTVLDSISEKELFYKVRSQYLSAMLSDLHLNTAKERYLLFVASLFSCAFTDSPPQKSTSSSSPDTSTSWACLTCRTLGCFTSTSRCRFMGSQWQMSMGRGGGERRGGDGGKERRRRRRSQPGWGVGSRAAHRSAGRQEALRWPATTRADSRNV